MYQQESNDVAAQTRCKSTTLAVIAKKFYESGVPVMSVSQLIRLGLEQFAEVLINSGAGRVDHVLDARTILERLGITGNTLNAGGRNRKSFLKELQLADYVHEGFNREELETVHTKNAEKKLDRELKEAALRTRAQLEELSPEQVREQLNIAEGIQEREKHYQEHQPKKLEEQKTRVEREREALAVTTGAVPLAHDSEWPEDEASKTDETENDTEHK